MKTKLFLLLSFFVISYSCYKEDAIKSTINEEIFVNFDSLKNQGTNIYQERLISYADKYKVLTLYNFNPTLFYYEVVARPPYTYTVAEEENVGALLDLIDEVFYPLIGDKAILKFSPLNVLLVSELNGDNGSADCYFGLYSLTFSGANENIKTWDKARKLLYKNNAAYGYLKRAYDKGFIEMSKEFGAVSEYNSKTVNAENYKEFGFVKNDSRDFEEVEVDFYSYLKLITSTSTEELTAKGGFLDPEVDTKGRIKSKYDILIKHFKQYDIDLVKIGNYQIK